MKKRITRRGKIIIAEVYQCIDGTEVIVDAKWFNFSLLNSLFNIEPTKKDYDKANKWADEVIKLQLENTKCVYK